MNTKSSHITGLLDESGFRDLTAEQIKKIETHTNNCAECRHSFESAKISAILLRENAATEISVSPFFQAKVLNAWREKQIVQKPLAIFRRWWQASATLVLLMCVTIIGLLMVSLIGSHTENVANRRQSSNVTLYSTETVILDEEKNRNLTTEQVFEILDDK